MQVSEQFFHSLYDYTLQVKEGKLPKIKAIPMPPEPVIDPLLGRIDHEKAIVWLRPGRASQYTLIARQEGKDHDHVLHMSERAMPDKDYCIHWHLRDLEADTKYCFDIEDENGQRINDQVLCFQTSSMLGRHTKTILAFGSCVDQDGRFPELWEQVEMCGVEGMVLLGDTPYIDSTVSIHQRIKQRTFLLQKGSTNLF